MIKHFYTIHSPNWFSYSEGQRMSPEHCRSIGWELTELRDDFKVRAPFGTFYLRINYE